ncbi:MAG: hypothetical protein AB7V20_14320 [Phycisphaerales bacterium]
MTATLTIGHGNVYVANRTPLKALRTIRSIQADSWGVNEGMNLMRLLPRLSGYRVTVGDLGPTRNDKRGTWDTPILTKKKLSPLGSVTIQASETVQPERIAPERWITGSLFQHAVGPVAHLNVHPNAAIRGHGTNVARVREYAEFMATLNRLTRWLQAEDFAVVITGVMATPDYDVTWYRLFRLRKMDHADQGLDVVAWDRRKLELVRKRVIPAGSRTGADHPWIITELKAAA